MGSYFQHINLASRNTSMKCVVFISLLVFVCLLADSQAWWSRRIPSRIGGYRRYGRSDPDVAQENLEEDYDDSELIEALVDVLMDRQEKRNVASLVRSRDLRNLGSFYGKRAVMNPMARNKGLAK